MRLALQRASEGERDEPLRALSESRSDSIGSASKRLLAAVHLAGHAVAADVCGLGYPGLTLAAAPVSERCGFSSTGDGRGRGPARNGIEAAIIASLAGIEAERLAGGDPDRACVDVTRWVTDGDARDAEPYIEWLRLKAERTVEHPLRQRIILAIARALLERETLQGSEIEALALHEAGLYMRGQ